MTEKNDHPFYNGKPLFTGDENYNAAADPLTADSLSKAVELMRQTSELESQPKSIRQFEYPPVSIAMKQAMDANGWGDREVSEFFGGIRKLPKPNGGYWVYGPSWYLMHGGEDE